MAKLAMFGVVLSMIRAILVKNETLWQRIKNMIAGVLAVIAAIIFLQGGNLSDAKQKLIVGTVGAFIGSMWPILEKGAISLAERITRILNSKKQHDVPGNDVD